MSEHASCKHIPMALMIPLIDLATTALGCSPLGLTQAPRSYPMFAGLAERPRGAQWILTGYTHSCLASSVRSCRPATSRPHCPLLRLTLLCSLKNMVSEVDVDKKRKHYFHNSESPECIIR